MPWITKNWFGFTVIINFHKQELHLETALCIILTWSPMVKFNVQSTNLQQDQSDYTGSTDKYNKETCLQLHNWPITNSMEQSISWEENCSSATQEILTFYEIPVFITLTQNPTTCTCPEPDQTSPHVPTYFSRIHFNIIHLFQDFLCCFFPSGSPSKPFVCLSCLPYILHSKPTSFLISFINRIT